MPNAASVGKAAGSNALSQHWLAASQTARQSGKQTDWSDYDYTNLLVAAIVMFINLDFEPVPSFG